MTEPRCGSATTGFEFELSLRAKVASRRPEDGDHHDDSGEEDERIVHFLAMSEPSDRIAETQSPM